MANAAGDKLTIVTSFPSDLTKVFKAEFNKIYPKIKLEILKKKTTAGVKYIQETTSNNTTDLFWASAPDAFEVLKDDSLLQKFESSVKGLPDKVGAFPVNDPEGYYKGFAAAGYGIMWNTRYLKAKKIPAPSEWVDLTKPVYHNHVGMSAPSRSGTTQAFQLNFIIRPQQLWCLLISLLYPKHLIKKTRGNLSIFYYQKKGKNYYYTLKSAVCQLILLPMPRLPLISLILLRTHQSAVRLNLI